MMGPESDVMALAKELAEARRLVSSLEEKWDSLFGTNPEKGDLKPRIVQFLEDHPSYAYRSETVCKALEANPNSVVPYLSALVKEGKIERRGRGMYGAIQFAG